MSELYDRSTLECSRTITRNYSTSFSLASSLLARPMRQAIYAIYGFVRLADEIVDTFHDNEPERLLREFEEQAKDAITRGISLNPILHSFQLCVRKYSIEWELIDAFLLSMKADLGKKAHDQSSFDTYVYGSAEVVGLMCLRVFVNGDAATYQRLTPSARALGSAFQQVNFLRDLRDDYEGLGRSYFPQVTPSNIADQDRLKIEAAIEECFNHALTGIRELPPGARLGVYVAYRYYLSLFGKLRALPTEQLMKNRVRINDAMKLGILFRSWLRYQVNAL